jgi:hypothetical protein
MSAYDRINARFKKASGGQSLEDRQKYWDNQQKELAKQKKELEDKIKKMKSEETMGMVGGVPANNVGTGNIAGLGVGPQGEPGVDKKRKKSVVPFKTFTRNPTRMA